jgi:hypothetical protein
LFIFSQSIHYNNFLFDSGVQMMQLVQDKSGGYKLIQLSPDDSSYPTSQQQQQLNNAGDVVGKSRKRHSDVGPSSGKKKKRKSDKPGKEQQPGAPKTMVVCSLCRKTFTKRVFQVSLGLIGLKI